MKWLSVDLLFVSGSAVIGRLSHAEAMTASGWWHTAWPFLTGTLVGWALVTAVRRPGGSVSTGLIVWPSTVLLGMLLRRASDQGTAISFIVVAGVVLGAMFVLPRLAVRLLR